MKNTYLCNFYATCCIQFFSNQGGVVYFESINCSVNIAMMTFHAAWFRGKFDKLGMVCIAGPPNIAKTNSLKVAMHMASSLNYFFSMKVLVLFVFKCLLI